MAGKRLLMRHADVYDAPGGKRVLYGNLPGFWLTQLGIRQAQATGDYIRDHCKLDMVVCSPLERTRQTAEIVLSRTGNNAKVVTEPGLRDIGVGPWEGRLMRDEWTEKRQVYWQRQLECAEDGLEHPEEMQQRALEVFHRHAEANPGANILYVSHGDIISFILQHFAGEPLEPLVHYHRGVNKASLFNVEVGPPHRVTKLFEPSEYGTVYPRPLPPDVLQP
jgi:broad specificity phosphatase PhoE